MGNSSSTKRKDWARTGQYSSDIEPIERTRSTSPFPTFLRAKSERLQNKPDVCDVPAKPGKAIVTLTNLQSGKPSGNCVTDSIYLDWRPPDHDGGRRILGYIVEMYDLPTGNWITVTETEGNQCRSVLDNILCGIMYRFRIRAFNEVGSSVPGIPSDSFVIDTPGVHIAPYFILCPPNEVSKLVHDTVQFRAKALGTPTPNILWQKDDEPIFVTQGIDIESEPDGSTLTVHNLQLEDDGVIECIAVNHVGKAISSTRLCVVCPPKFKTGNIPSQFTFRVEDMIRLKLPIEAQPDPLLTLLKDEIVQDNFHCRAILRDNNVIVKINSAKETDSGEYRIEADNGMAIASFSFSINVEVPPSSPSMPDILDVAPTGELTLAWQPPDCAVDHYIVEYYRDQWQLWLRMKTCLDTVTVITDLIPGSKYKFRIMAASISGISEASPESEEIMIGKVAEDELFDLPARGRPTRQIKKMRKIPSFDRASLDRSIASREVIHPERRHTSLDREVYYDANNVRRDVVTYNKPPELDRLGFLANKYELSNEEIAKYRMSMSQLCHKMKAISNSSIGVRSGSKISLDTATKPLQMEISNQARKSNSMGQLCSVPGIPQHQSKSVSSNYLDRKTNILGLHPSERTGLSNNIGDCKKSLSDIQDRIGSLQALLKTSRSLTSSKQSLFADLPTFAIPKLESRKIEKVVADKTFKTHRNNSYANAIEGDPVVELSYQETHFPFNPELASLGSLECDKFPQKNDVSNRNSLFLTECEEEVTVTETAEAPLEHNTDDNRTLSEVLNNNNNKNNNFDQSFDISEVSYSSRTLLYEDSSSNTNIIDYSSSSQTLLVDPSSSSQTVLCERSLSSCSQGTLVSDGASMNSDTE
ncbi:titin isoform X2 [Eurytemora carolleeae]|uniref:titin isoform X2 n=1 Tax=Eurytemora carolleeae TaxID=1294199 RepID=UPI000C75FE4E|nr:titin isoform X2 [Eurytemora carolleeae]|eukprot:XP_023325298.1 titin-like isoform X2 [Eurytemora affinis]